MQSVALSLVLSDQVVLHFGVVLRKSTLSHLSQSLSVLSIGTLLHLLQVGMDLLRFTFNLGLGCGSLVISVLRILRPHLSHVSSVLCAFVSER